MRLISWYTWKERKPSFSASAASQCIVAITGEHEQRIDAFRDEGIGKGAIDGR